MSHDEPFIAPHFADITLIPVRTAPREGAIVYDEKTKLLYYSSNYKWIPTSNSGPISPIPQGIVVQNSSPSGTTFSSIQIISSSSAISISHGNGVGGNPTLIFNGETFPQGILSGQTSPNGTVVNGVTLTSSSPQILISSGNGVGGNPTLTLNLPQGILAEQTSPNGTVINGITLTSSSSTISIVNGNGVGGNPILSFNGQTFPQGMLIQTQSPSGTTVVGRTITSSSSDITVTNGNGVGGNPLLTFNRSGVFSFNGRTGIVVPQLGDYSALLINSSSVGLLPGPTLQDDVNYLGTIFKNNNGFSGILTPNPQTVTTGTQPVMFASDSIGFDDGAYDPVGGRYFITATGFWNINLNLVVNTSASGNAVNFSGTRFFYSTPSSSTSLLITYVDQLKFTSGTILQLILGVLPGQTISAIGGSLSIVRYA
jgi:hypothetical protein